MSRINESSFSELRDIPCIIICIIITKYSLENISFKTILESYNNLFFGQTVSKLRFELIEGKKFSQKLVFYFSFNWKVTWHKLSPSRPYQ